MPIYKVSFIQRTASINNLHPDLDLASQEIVKILNKIESKPLAYIISEGSLQNCVASFF